MSLLRSGRARLALALPRHRELLHHVKSRELDDLFEAYAVAAETLERHRRDFPHRDELIAEYLNICLDIQADVLSLLEKVKAAGE